MFAAPEASGESSIAARAATSLADPRLIEARRALLGGDVGRAAECLEAAAAHGGEDPIALCLQADIALRQDRFGQAEDLYRRCLALAPGYLDALHGLGSALFSQARLAEAAAAVDRMLSLDPANLPARLLRAAVLAHAGDHRGAALFYRGIVGQRPDHVPSWIALGHCLRAIGATSDAVGAYRTALAHAPLCGEAWGSLLALKTYRFDEGDLAAMLGAAERPDLPASERTYLHFALGRAFFDRNDDDRAFAHYAQANALARTQRGLWLSGPELDRWVEASIRAFAARRRPCAGLPAGMAAPIFVVGLPRAGTTLVEQILASHSQIEALGELPYVEVIARRLASNEDLLAAAEPAELAAEYLGMVQAHRRTDKPRFVDKLPANRAHVALIRAMFPDAPVVDVRRHPLASCVAIFRQHFLGMPELAGSLADLARLWRGYAAAMRHFDRALPGAVHRLHYECLVEDLEGEVRRLLAHVEARFESACLRWYENGASIGTPSSEQVRQPIFRHGLAEWRRFDRHLSAAREILADEIAAYPSEA